MKEKFKMSQFGPNMTGKGWLKELLLTIVGTAIGVGLTFFVNDKVEDSHQRSAQRETAIMAVCDIDEIVQGLKDEIQLEDSLFQVTMYVSTHQELIDSLPMDTLDMAFKYLYDNPTVVKEWTANTKENAFNSGIDARMNLGNNQFYDNVQQCYYVRRSLMKVMADAPMFHRPFSKDAYEDFLYELPPTAIDYDGIPHPNARRLMMKQVFAHKSTTLYIKRYFIRKDTYKKAVWNLERLNRENKMLMDITDEDIETYLKKYSNRVQTLDIAGQIIGKWESNLETPQTYVFQENNIFEFTTQMPISMQIQLGEENMEVFTQNIITVHTTGRWELRGDTLLIDYDDQKAEITDFDIDTSNFPQSALERLKDSLDIKREEAKSSMQDYIRQWDMKSTQIVSFDKYGKTMIWIMEETTPAGNKHTTSKQLTRNPE